MRPRIPGWVVPTVVTVAAGLWLLVRLGAPDAIVFDEIYYVEDARSLLATGAEDGFTVHPPVGKWLIAAGIALGGDTPAGWRAAGGVVGVLTVLLTYLLTRRLTGRTWAGLLGAGLLALDGVFVVQARTAMLDVFVVGFVVLGAWLLVLDRQRSGRGTEPPPGGSELERSTAGTEDATARPQHALRARWALLAAGVAFGLAVATKWSGVLALVAAGVLALVWEAADARRLGATAGRAVARTLTVVALGLAVPAVLTYGLSWTPWLTTYEQTWTAGARCPQGTAGEAPDCPSGIGDRLGGLMQHHRDIAAFHLDLDADHPYRAPATTWPLQRRPVVYHWDSCGPDEDPDACGVAPGNAVEVIGLGNLALWWGGWLLVPVLAWGVWRRDGRSAVPLTFLALQFLPWLVVARPVFSFYAAPMVPFLAAGAAVACVTLDRPPWYVGRWVATLLSAAAVALAVYFAPLWLAIEVPEDVIRRRWWFDSWV
jgi:dolichyl-phosphate-mannose-protein mannosyltransferase